MKKVTDTSRSREFIWANRNKLNNNEILEELLRTTKLKRNTIKNLIGEVLNPDIKGYNLPTGYHAKKAQEYIRNNIGKLSKEQIIDYITENMFLSGYTANKIYLTLELEEKIKLREAATDNKIKYKGKTRVFFEFDDSKLYRGLIK